MSPFTTLARVARTGRSLASTPASRKTIANAHHATPRTAHAPIRAMAATSTQSGHRTRSRRRSISTTVTTTDG